MMSAFDPMVLLRFCGQFRLARNPIFLVQSGQFGLGLPWPPSAVCGSSSKGVFDRLNDRYRKELTFSSMILRISWLSGWFATESRRSRKLG